jgi:hypothetical protein
MNKVSSFFQKKANYSPSVLYPLRCTRFAVPASLYPAFGLYPPFGLFYIGGVSLASVSAEKKRKTPFTSRFFGDERVKTGKTRPFSVLSLCFGRSVFDLGARYKKVKNSQYDFLGNLF